MYLRYPGEYGDAAQSASWTTQFKPVAGEPGEFGVRAAVYQKGTTKVLVFRGGATNGDYSNIVMTMGSWMVDKFQNKAIENWEAATGESVDQDPKNADMVARAVKDKLADRLLFDAQRAAQVTTSDKTYIEMGYSNDYLLV